MPPWTWQTAEEARAEARKDVANGHTPLGCAGTYGAAYNDERDRAQREKWNEGQNKR